MRRWFAALVGLVILFAIMNGRAASGAVIVFHGTNTDANGTGFGTILHILTLQDDQPHADGREAGSVLWDGQKDVFGTVGGGIDTKTQLSLTRTAGELLAAGFGPDRFAVLLDINQPGSNPSIDLSDFTARFQNPQGQTLFDAQFDDSDSLNSDTSALIDGHGMGKSAFVFPVLFGPGEAQLFFSNPANRIGIFVNNADAITGAAGGPETFYVGPVSNSPDIPEPAISILSWIAAIPLMLWRSQRIHAAAGNNKRLKAV